MKTKKFACLFVMIISALLLSTFGSRLSAQEELTFDDFKFDMKKSEKFDPAMITDDIKKYSGKKIVIRGYIRPSFKQNNLKQFILVRDDQECCFGPGAALFDCMIVRMAKGKSTNFTVRPVAVEGEFKVRIFEGPDGKPWAVYQLKGFSVK